MTSRGDIDNALDALQRDLVEWHGRARVPGVFWHQLRALAVQLIDASRPEDATYIGERLLRMLSQAHVDLRQDPAFKDWLAQRVRLRLG